MESEALAGKAAPTAVVWTPAGTDVPQELRTALGNGGLKVMQARGVYTALAAICRLDRAAGGDSKGQCALVLVNPGTLEAPGALCGAAEKYAARARVWMYTTGATRLRAVTPADVKGWGEGSEGQPAEPPLAPAGGQGKIKGPKPHSERPKGRAQPYSPQSPHGQPAVTITRGAGGVGNSRTAPGASGPVQAADPAPKLRLAGDAADLMLQGEGAGADASGSGESGKEARPRPVLTPEELEMLLRDDEQD